jgi:hypothetical protein
VSLALSDMSREALVRELRVAKAKGDSARVRAIKRLLVDKKPKPFTVAQAPDNAWWRKDD